MARRIPGLLRLCCMLGVLLINIILGTNRCSAQVSINFSASTTGACSPFNVVLIDSSTATNGIAQRIYRFNDTLTFSTANDVDNFVLLSPGSYDLKLIVVDSLGNSDSLTKPAYLSVFNDPFIGYNFITTHTYCVGEFAQIQRDLASSPGCGTFDMCVIDWGDGTVDTTSCNFNEIHQYNISGTFQISLLAINSCGCSYVDANALTAIVRPDPVSTFTVPQSIICDTPFAANLVPDGPALPEISYVWTFTGNYGTLTDSNHTPTIQLPPDRYTVSLSVIDTAGCNEFTGQANALRVFPGGIGYTKNGSIFCPGDTVTFEIDQLMKDLGLIFLFYKVFDASGMLVDLAFTLDYFFTTTDTGTYDIELFASQFGCNDSVYEVASFTFRPPPVIEVTPSDTILCNDSAVVLIEGLTENIAEWDWTLIWSDPPFEDTIHVDSAQSWTLIHDFRLIDTFGFDLLVNVVDSNGCESSTRINDYIDYSPNVFYIQQPSDPDKCIPHTISYNSVFQSFDSIISFNWDVNEDNITDYTGSPITHTDTIRGCKKVRAIVTTSTGCVSYDSVDLCSGIKLDSICPIIIYDSICHTDSIILMDTCDILDDLVWTIGQSKEFADSFQSNFPNKVGMHAVFVAAIDTGCVGDSIFVDSIFIKGSIPGYDLVPDCSNIYRYSFLSTTQVAYNAHYTLWLWENVSTGERDSFYAPGLADTAIVFDTVAIYTIWQIVYDTLYGCIDTNEGSVVVQYPTAVADTFDKTHCIPANFMVNNVSDFTNRTFWYVNGVAPSNLVISGPGRIPISFNVTDTTTWDVYMVNEDANGCRDTLYIPDFIVTEVYSEIGYIEQFSCINDTTVIFDQSYAPFSEIVSWEWITEDLNKNSYDTFYTDTIRYVLERSDPVDVTLVMTDSIGCSASITDRFFFQGFEARFTLEDTLICVGDTATFENVSQAIAFDWHAYWNFHDTTWYFHNEAHATTLSRVYDSVGIYEVLLITIDSNASCVDSLRDTIEVIESLTAFRLDTNYYECTDIVAFYDSTAGSFSWWWKIVGLNDTVISSLENPSTLLESGLYSVEHYAVSTFGCTDTIFEKDAVLVDGPFVDFNFYSINNCNPVEVMFVLQSANVDTIIIFHGDGINTTIVEVQEKGSFDTLAFDTVYITYNASGYYVPSIQSNTVGLCPGITVAPGDTVAVDEVVPGIATMSLFVGCDSSVYSFADNSTSFLSGLPDVARIWIFHDGTTDTGQTVVKTFDTTGLVSYDLVVETDQGCTDTLTGNLLIQGDTGKSDSIQRSLCVGESDTIGGVVISTSGFHAILFPDTLSGCDSILVVEMSILPLSFDTTSIDLCRGSDTTINSITYHSSGQFQQVLTGFNTCDSILTILVNIRDTSTETMNATICSNGDTTINTVLYNTGGVFTQTLTNYLGCDSVLTINVTALDTSVGSLTASICANADTTINGMLYNVAGNYQQTLVNHLGCDSILDITILELDTSTASISAEICSNGDTTINSVLYNSAGTYSQTLVNHLGCDSILTIVIIELDTSTASIGAAICENSDTTINGVLYDSAGIYTQTLINHEGCDSVLNITISTLPIDTTNLSATICANGDTTINGMLYNSAGTFTQNWVNANGCDSLLIITINVNDTSTDSINAIICSNGDTTINAVLYNTGGVFTQTLTNHLGCDSILTVNIIELDTSVGSITASICANDDTTINGMLYSAAGNYQQTLVNHLGCDSILDITILELDTSTATINAEICSNADTTINSVLYNSAGTYSQTLVNHLGCDSILTIVIIELDTSTASIGAAICENSDTTINGVLYDSAGIYTQTLINHEGCDSVLNITISTLPIDTTNLSATICANGDTTINGMLYNSAGTFTQNWVNANGCDSLLIITINVNDTSTEIINATICSNSDTTINSVLYNTGGVFTQTLTNHLGCDSVLTINVTELDTSVGSLMASICANADTTINGMLYSAAGNYQQTLVNHLGCDSILGITIIELDTSTASISATICSNGDTTINSVLYSSAGTYSQTLANHLGCDSILTITIIELDTSTASISAAICANSDTTINGVLYNSAGVYTQTLTNHMGCDSVLNITISTLSLDTTNLSATICSNRDTTINGMLYNSSGTFTQNWVNVNGCDSLLIITINVNDTSTEIINAMICSNGDTTINAVLYNTGGVFTQTLTNHLGCDSVLMININVLDTSVGSITASICANADTTINGMLYSAAGNFQQTLINHLGCDSILEITVIELDTSTASISAEICSNEDTTINSVLYNSAGTYSQTLVNHLGCDSILTIAIIELDTSTASISAAICANTDTTINGFLYNSAGVFTQSLTNHVGCDSVLNITISTLPLDTTNLSATICSNADTTINGMLYNSAGTFTQSWVNANGCDSLLIITINVNDTSAESINATICSNGDTTINSMLYNAGGTFRQTLTNYLGCDSVLTINIVELDTSVGSITASICANADTTINGLLYSAAGNYQQTLVNHLGCDSVLDITIIELDTSTASISAEICSNGDTTINSVSYNGAGTYSQTLVNHLGCDSILTITIIKLDTSTASISAAICANTDTTINGFLYNSAGVFTQSLTNHVGCDSLLNITISTLPLDTTNLSATICSNADTTINGMLYNSAGTFTQSWVNANACDSLLIITINVHDTSAEIINATICSNGDTTINAVLYNTGGSFSQTLTNHLGCDSILTININVSDTSSAMLEASICYNSDTTINGVLYNAAGSYQQLLTNHLGCDSFLAITIHEIDSSYGSVNAVICSNHDTTINGVLYDSAGNFKQQLINYLGCDSFLYVHIIVDSVSFDTLSFDLCRGEDTTINGSLINISGPAGQLLINHLGCDSFLTYNINWKDTFYSVFTATTCFNEDTMIYGVNYQVPGQYFQPLVTIDGCDSLLEINIQSYPEANDTISIELCYEEDTMVNGFNYAATGVYTQLLTVPSSGCDSTLVIFVNVLPEAIDTIYAWLCPGDDTVFNAVNYNNPGVYLQLLTAHTGCDSTLVIDIDPLPIKFDSTLISLCAGSDTTINGQLLNAAGTFVQNLTAGNGCDSFYTINVSIRSTSSDSLYYSFCDGQSVTVNGINYSVSGVYQQQLVNYLNCDSTLNIEIEVTNTTYGAVSETFCSGSFSDINGLVYDSTASDTQRLVNHLGCDSMLSVAVTELPVPLSDISFNLCEGDVEVFKGVWFTTDSAAQPTIIRSIDDQGCLVDWRVNIFADTPVFSDFEDTLCVGEELSIAGVTYTSAVQNDTLSFPKHNSTCDSHVVVNLSFIDPPLILNTVPWMDTILLTNNSNLLNRVFAIGNGIGNFWWIDYTGLSSTGNSGANSLLDVADSTFDLGNINDTAQLIFVYADTSNTVCPADSVVRIIIPYEEIPFIAIPTGFSPNGDGINDAFRVFIHPAYEDRIGDVSMEIFNRWGQKIYYDTEFLSWDGLFKGVNQPLGVYTYQVFIEVDNKRYHYSGNVTLIR